MEVRYLKQFSVIYKNTLFVGGDGSGVFFAEGTENGKFFPISARRAVPGVKRVYSKPVHLETPHCALSPGKQVRVSGLRQRL